MLDKVLSPQETADYLGIATMTLWKWRASRPNDLPYIKVGRFVRYRASDVENFLRKNTIGASSFQTPYINRDFSYADQTL